MVLLGIVLSGACVEGMMGCAYAIARHASAALVHWIVAAFFTWIFWKIQKTFNERYR